MLGAYGVGLASLASYSMLKGKPYLTSLLVIVASHVSMAVAALIEGGVWRLLEVFNPITQSWAFLFGDIFIAIAAGLNALAWRRLRFSYGYQFPARVILGVIAFTLLLGAAGGILFHLSEWRGEAYGHAVLVLQSPTKLMHDLVTYTILLACLAYGIVPLLYRQPWAWTALLVGPGMWLSFTRFDVLRLMRNLHRPYIYRPNLTVDTLLGALTILILAWLVFFTWKTCRDRRKEQ